MRTPSWVVECRPPYSFYADFIKLHWHAEKADYHPLHRLTTLARKQGAESIVCESAIDRPEIVDEITELDETYGGGGLAEAIACTFVSKALSPEGTMDIEPQTLIGQCVVINYRPPQAKAFEHTYIYEAVFATPAMPGGSRLLNNFINADADFIVDVRGQRLPVTGIYYCQQNGRTSVCAHAAIRMVINTMRPDQPRVSTRTINEAFGEFPADGVYADNIKDVIERITDLFVDLVDCGQIASVKCLSAITSAAESGDMSLLTFTTPLQDGDASSVIAPREDGEGEETRRESHVVAIFGHTLNSDEWHPQGLRAYGAFPGSQSVSSSAWVDNFVIHDDNMGPYFTLSSRALELDDSIKASNLLIVRREPCPSKAFSTEAMATAVLSKLLPLLSGVQANNSWLTRVTTGDQDFVTRPLLVSREGYLSHLEAASGHDGSRALASQLEPLKALPERFWMVEFTIADLFTGNKSKLGEVLLETDWDRCEVSMLIGVRLPGLFCLRKCDTDRGSQVVHNDLSLMSHTGIYRVRNHDHEW